ncbi:MAG: peptidoglycan D,D-transpeptidase FtsI family protein [Sedimentisphaerales bacterium]
MRKKFAIFLLILIILGFLGVVARCFYLQDYKADYYYQSSQRSQKATFLEKSRRGAILDCRGRILAASYKVDTVFAEPQVITDLKETAKALSDIIGISPSEISKSVLTSRNTGYAPIISDAKLTDTQRKEILKLHGIGIESKWKRFYPLGSVAAHVVGFVGTDEEGLAGLELKYNAELSGTAGKSTFFADAARRPVRLGQCESFAQDGSDMILTLDSTIQEFTHAALLKQMNEFQAESAVALVMNPHTGAVLSLVSLPDFDPADLSKVKVNEKNLGNHALSDPYEPGSIFKPFVAAWAIETGSVGRNTTIYCENGSYSGKGFGTIGEYRNGYGNLKIAEILSHSSNIGMAKIGQKMGAKKTYEGIKNFGFGRKTNIDLPGEEPGVVWNYEKWTGYSVARVPFGHEVSVTAMQMACAFCALANDGKGIRPHLALAIISDAGEKVKRIDPAQTGGFIISDKTAKWMVRDALTLVVTDGTGKKAALEKWQVFGKTGTANIAHSDTRGYDEQNYVASFIGGAPAEKPAVIVLVSIRKPNKRLGKGYTGGSVAAPVAAEILQNTLTYMKIPGKELPPPKDDKSKQTNIQPAD